MCPALDIDGALVEHYADAAHDALASDETVAAARDSWASFVRTSHGEVFDSLEGSNTVDRLFVESLSADFLFDGLLDALEAATGATITNRDPRANTDTLDVAFGDLHDRILAPEDGRERVRAAVSPADLRSLTPGDLRALYERAVDPARRLALGEYYTPRAVADLTVAAVDPAADATVLDPGCGAGVFLTAALDARRDSLPEDPRERVRAATERIAGIDVNPVAVKSTKLAYGCALFDSLTSVDTVALPVYLADALGLTSESEIRVDGEPVDMEFDTLVGNPPWVPWERLSDRHKRRWRDRYVDELGLQPHEGATARLGHSNDDVAVPYAWTCIHRYLRPGGRAGFVLKRDAMRGPAGAVLRQLRVGDRSLALTGVHDFAALDPFGVGANAAVYAFRADRDPSFPVGTTVWTPGVGTPNYESGTAFRASASATETELVPTDPDDPTTAWVRADAERAAMGECAHDIRHGLKDDATAVFGIDRGTLPRVDEELVYPYLQSRHIRRWGTNGHDLRLVPQRRAGEDNEATLRETYPATYDYLRDHREALLDRQSSWLDRGPFYSVFGLGEYTWAPYRVVWCRLGFKPEFAVVTTRSDPDVGEKQVVPGDHYMFVATDSRETAHFLCALLNAAPYRRTLRGRASDGKASLSKAVVSELALPAWPDTETSRQLADYSMRAHELVAADGTERDTATLDAIEAAIDGLVEDWLAET